MATVTKAVLKTYFEQGDIPTQGQYVDLIDSQFGLGETGTQIIQGTISASAAEFEQMTFKKLYLPGNGIKSMKVGSTFTVGKTLEISGSLRIEEGNISASGDLTITNITASGAISASANALITAQDLTLDRQLTTDIVSASGGITGSHIYSSANIIAGNRVTSDYGTVNYGLTVNELGHGGGDFRVESADNLYMIWSDAGTNKIAIGTVTPTSVLTVNGDITATDITASGAISSSGLLTVDTLTIGATYNNTSITFSDTAFTNNNKAFSITTTLPNIGTGTYCDDTTVTNSSVATNSVIIASANREVSVFCHTIAAGSFKFTATGFGADFSSAAVRINFIVL